MPRIISQSSSVMVKNLDDLPSFACIAAGIPSPSIEWVLLGSNDSDVEMTLTSGEKYEITSNVSQLDDGSFLTHSVITFLTLSVNDTGKVTCKTGSSLIVQNGTKSDTIANVGYVNTKNVLLTVIGM